MAPESFKIVERSDVIERVSMIGRAKSGRFGTLEQSGQNLNWVEITLHGSHLFKYDFEKIFAKRVRHAAQLVQIAEQYFRLGKHCIAFHLDLFERLHEHIFEYHQMVIEECGLGLEQVPQGFASLVFRARDGER